MGHLRGMWTGLGRSSRGALAALLGGLFLFAVVITILGYGVFRDQRSQVLRQVHDELAAIADLKVREIVLWRQERLADARLGQANPLLLEQVDRLRRRPGDPVALRLLQGWLKAFTEHFAFKSVALADGQGRVLLAVGGDPKTFETHHRTFLLEAVRDRKVLLSDIHEEPGADTHLALLVPLSSPAADGGAVKAVLYLQVDPGEYLFPLVGSWPTPSPSGESLLVRREGDEVVFLNAVRHRSGAPLRLRLPMDTVDLPAAVAARGEAATMVGRDYRGVKVLAVTRPVPDSPWFLVAKIDFHEVLGPIAARARATAVISALAFLCTAALVLLLWRQQRVIALRKALVLSERHREDIEKAGAAVHESEERYRGLFTHMAEGMAYCRMEFEGEDPRDFVYLEVNDAFGRLTGLGDVVGRRVSEVLPGIRERDRRLFEIYGKVARGGAPERFEMYVQSLQRWFAISVYSPRLEHFIVVFDVITERKRAEAELARTLAELRRSNRELEQFAYVASHDLQEPLRLISSFLQLLERRSADRIDDEGREFIRFAVDGANRLQTMIEGLLEYSRIGRRPCARAAVGLGRVLEAAKANLGVAIEAAGAVVTNDPLPTVTADEGQLVRVIQNLIGNAVKYAGAAPPRIHVSCTRDADGVVVRVRDNGIGIAPEHHEKIFEIFRRLHGPSVPGAGLGLALCRRIVEHAGGKIWVESEPGQGAVFSFSLPERGGDAP